MSISGNGMFAVSSGLSGGQTYYTRNGAFDTDSSGNLYLSGTNYYLQGWPTDTNGNVTAVNSDNLASLENVNVDKYNSSAVATTAYTLSANFPAAAQNDLGSISYTATGGVTEDLSVAYVPTSTVNASGTTTYQVAVNAPTGVTITDGGTPSSQLMFSVTVVNGLVTQAVDMSSGTVFASGTGSFPAVITPSNSSPAATATTMPGTSWGTFTSSVGSGFVKSTSMTVYDSLGVAETCAVDWTAAGQNSWIMTVNSPTNAAGTTSTGSLNASTASTTTTSSYSYLVSFNSDGTLKAVSPEKIYNSAGVLIGTAPTSTTGEAEISATWNDGASASTVSLNLGTAGQTNGLSQFSTTSSTSLSINVKSYSQNGVQYGSLTGVSISSSGNVIASYDNGQQVSIYKIPVVTFPNENGLTELSGGVYAQSMNSGNYTLHSAGQDGSGTVEGATLESSTVNTTVEFSNMITAQQAYSSASQVISSDKKMFDSLISVVQG
jgi:flagellar hook protein FlgE